VWVRGRIEALVGQALSAPTALAERMSPPWMLYALFVQVPNEITETETELEDETQLGFFADRVHRETR
jgi:hypothetical protein